MSEYGSRTGNARQSQNRCIIRAIRAVNTAYVPNVRVHIDQIEVASRDDFQRQGSTLGEEDLWDDAGVGATEQGNDYRLGEGVIEFSVHGVVNTCVAHDPVDGKLDWKRVLDFVKSEESFNP